MLFLRFLFLFFSFCYFSWSADIDVDLSSKRYSVITCDDMLHDIGQSFINNGVYEIATKKSVKINLSNNYLTDDVISNLIRAFQQTHTLFKIHTLDITNNRITANGLKTLIPLLLSSKFQWLVAPINCFNIDGISQIVEAIPNYLPPSDPFNFIEEHCRIFIQNDVEHSTEIDKLTSLSVTEIIDSCLNKLIWLPKNHFETPGHEPPIPPSQIEAHKIYYEID